MKNKKKMIIVFVILLVIGFASVSATLVITGVIGVSTKKSDFNVKFTNAKLGEVERKDFINVDNPKFLDYTIEDVTEVGVPTTLNYEVTNTSRLYDAEVSVTCNIVDGDNNPITSEYISMDYAPSSMIIVPGESKNGSITTTLIKSSTTAQSIKVRCELNASAIERDTLGEEYIPTVSFPEGYTLIDTNKNGEADIGEEIAIGSEHFYVIYNEVEKLEALAKYHLNVGERRDTSKTEGIQHETANGQVQYRNGYVAYSSTSQNYEGSIVKEYVDEYISKLNKSNITGRLITKSELEKLGCDSSIFPGTCKGSNVPKWLYNVSYWTQTPDSALYDVWVVHSDGDFSPENYFDNGYNEYGVRPVITINKPITLPEGVELLEDKGTIGTLDEGDKIKVGTENFYVISFKYGKLNALAEYNLSEGKQKSGGDYPVAFSNQSGWDNADNKTINIKSDENANGPVKTALYGTNGYEDYVKQQVPDKEQDKISVRLITKKEIEDLINFERVLSDESIKELADGKQYQWLYSTSYWTQSARDGSYPIYVWVMFSDGHIGSNPFSYGDGHGIRPVITISLT